MDTQVNKKPEKEIDLIESLRLLWYNRKTIIKSCVAFLFIGFIVAISIPKEYSCIVKMAPEGAKSSITGSMSDLAAIAGIDIGKGNTEGINLTLYPDIVQSIPFITELISIKISDTSEKNTGTLYNYIDKELKSPWWNSVFTLPFKIVELFQPGKDSETNRIIDPRNLTKKQDEIFTVLRERISVNIDKKTGIITAGVTMQNPIIAAAVADTLVLKLERFVIDYRTNKAKQDFVFALKVFTDSKQKYYEAQKIYAQYVDNNKNIIRESVLIEQERLKNEQSMAYNVYSNLAQQVEQARLKVQEQTPCVTIIEPASVPVKKSNTSRLSIMVLFGVFGLAFGAFIIIYSNWDKIQVHR